MKLYISKLPLLDPAKYRQDSPWWQFCILVRNMEDPRFAAGVNIMTAFQSGIVALFFLAAYFYWQLPVQCPKPPSGVIANEQPNR